MAAFIGSPSISLPRPLLSKPQLTCTSQQQPQTNNPPQPQPPSPSPPPPQPPPPPLAAVPKAPKPPPLTSSTAADSTDWIASSLTRRFGLGAGLAWVTFLAVGVVSEQIKTRFEASQQEANTKDVEKEEEVLLPNGIRYYELRKGGGASPKQGDLVVIDLEGRVVGSSEQFVNTFEGKRPLALVMGSRPYTKGMCEGVETVLRSMRAGGKRRVIVPPSLGFGDEGADLGSGVMIPPDATLEFVVQVDRVSIAPA